MSPYDVQAAINTQVPFRITMNDGTQHDIINLKTVEVGESALLIGIYPEGQEFPRWTMYALKNIVSIKPLTPAEIS